MTVDKFGSHILDNTSSELSYICVLPILGHDHFTVKLPSGKQNSFYYLNGEGPSIKFPLPDSELINVQAPSIVKFIINDETLNAKDLIGRHLNTGAYISLITENSNEGAVKKKLPGSVLVNFVVRYRLDQKQDE